MAIIIFILGELFRIFYCLKHCPNFCDTLIVNADQYHPTITSLFFVFLFLVVFFICDFFFFFC